MKAKLISGGAQAERQSSAAESVSTNGQRRKTSAGKLDALRKRVDEMKAALEAVQAQERQQEKEDDRRVSALIGAALVADVEAAEPEERARRKAYISEVLARNTIAGPSRAFLRLKGWL